MREIDNQVSRGSEVLFPVVVCGVFLIVLVAGALLG